MARWLDGAADRKILFNIRRGDHFGCRALDIHTGQRRDYDRPIYTLSSDGRFALSPNFGRLDVLRPGYGYAGVPDPRIDEPAPADDGIWRLDLDTGEARLILSMADLLTAFPDNWAPGTRHWFNHLLIGPGDERFVFLHRCRASTDVPWTTRMFTAGVDGGDVWLLNDHRKTSHFIWRDPQTVLAWANRDDLGEHYHLFTDRTHEVRPVAPEVLTRDGHMSYAPQGEWIVTDEYPAGEPPQRRLMLFHEPSERLVELGRYHSPPPVGGNPCRCDLHPRWSRDGRSVTFDSVHEGTRQVYSIDVSAIVQQATGSEQRTIDDER